MTRNELLKLPKGDYLLTDDIVNYKFVLRVFDKKEEDNVKLIAFLFDYFYYTGENLAPHTAIFYTTREEEVEWRYQRQSIKKLEGLCKTGSIGDSYDFYKGLRDLRLVGKYNKDTIREDMEKFKTDWWINLPSYDKKRKRLEKLKRK